MMASDEEMQARRERFYGGFTMGSAGIMNKRIFVGIASYRDPECQWTVNDMFEKAAHPERVFAGICWQSIKEEDADCFAVPYSRPEQVRVIDVDARESRGVCWARSKIQTLWGGEEYVLQIDSHMRFEKGWDDTLISMLEACPSARPVLTTYPPGYTPPGELATGWIFLMRATAFEEDAVVRFMGKAIAQVDAPASPIPGYCCSANFLFGSSAMLREIPYDPHLYFFGEEITMTVRLWTHGWDIFHPNRNIVYHQWDRSVRRHTHFSDHGNWRDLDDCAKRRARHLVGIEVTDDSAALVDIDRYGPGAKRTLAQYELFSGIDFRNRVIRKPHMNGVENMQESPKPFFIQVLSRPSIHQSAEDYKFYDIRDAHGERVFCIHAEGADIAHFDIAIPRMIEAVNGERN